MDSNEKSVLASLRNQVIAWVTLIVAMILALAGMDYVKGLFKPRKEEDPVVAAVAERLDGQVVRGRYQRVDPATVTETDKWGHRLQIEYRDEGVGERLIVRSAGPDGGFGSDDDITASRLLLNSKGIGEVIQDGTAGVAREAVRGAIRGVKDEVKDLFKRKPKEETAEANGDKARPDTKAK